MNIIDQPGWYPEIINLRENIPQKFVPLFKQIILFIPYEQVWAGLFVRGPVVNLWRTRSATHPVSNKVQIQNLVRDHYLTR
jgi:hypothetical protein